MTQRDTILTTATTDTKGINGPKPSSSKETHGSGRGALSESFPASRKVYDSFSKFKAENDQWQDISERAYQYALKL